MVDGLPALIDDYLDGALDDAGAAELERAIEHDAVAAALYAERVTMRQHLAERMRFEAAEEGEAMLIAEPADRAVWAWRRPAAIAAALVMGGLIAAIVAVVMSDRSTDDAGALAGRGDDRPVGVVLKTAAAVWSSEPLYDGDNLPRRTMRLDAGRLEFESGSGAMVTLHGPATLTTLSSSRMRLEGGLLRANVPPGSEGFTVDGPRGWSVIDLGTRFDVDLAADGRMRVIVDEGHVLLRSPDGRTIELTAGDGRTITGNDRVVEPADDPWLRWRLAMGRLRSDPDLLAMYDFEDDAKSVARLHNAIVGAGRFGDRTLSLAGDGYASIDGPGELSAFTLTAWVNPNRIDPDLTALVMVNGWGAAGVHWQLFNGRPKLNIQGQPDFEAPAAVEAGRWQHVAATFDGPGGLITLYIDGEPLIERRIAPNSKAVLGEATIGAWRPQGLYPSVEFMRAFDGGIDEVAIFGRAMTARNIREIYETTRHLNTRRDNRGSNGKEIDHGATDR